jgi:predicted ATPase
MITSMHIENFKCFRDFDIDLGPFNVLIGPNDSGKTAFLQAVGAVVWLGASTRAYVPVPDECVRGTPREVTWRHDTSLDVLIEAHADLQGGNARGPFVRARLFDDPDSGVCSFRSEVVGEEEPPFAAAKAQLPERWQTSWFPGESVRAAYYHFDPDALRRPSHLAQGMGPNGEALPSFLDDINRDDPGSFERIKDEFCRRFPQYAKPRVVVVSPGNDEPNVLEIRFPTPVGHEFHPDSVSDGVMLSLAFLALVGQPDPPRILLVEQPEDGVHHASLKDIVGTLKQLNEEKGVQVILTTHSPYLLDQVAPEAVHVFTKDEEGAVHARRLSDFEGAGEIGDMFATGEKWTLLSQKYGI